MTTCPVALEARKVRRALNGDGTPQDSGSPGYFKTMLETGVQVELTATRRTALHRYTFPVAKDSAVTNQHIIIDLTNDGQKSGYKTELKIEPERGRVTGGATFYASFGRGTYRAFVCADFAEEIPEPSSKPSKFLPHKRHGLMVRENLLTPTKHGTYLSNMVFPGNTTLEEGVHYNQDQGAILAFGSNIVVARVGISLISADQACHNAESEIPSFGSNSEPATSTFELIRRSAKEEWQTLLERFDLHAFDGKGGGVDLKMASLFYSSVYRSHIVPADCRSSYSY
jgi:putative alpha-1,2-mannosidase